MRTILYAFTRVLGGLRTTCLLAPCLAQNKHEIEHSFPPPTLSLSFFIYSLAANTCMFAFHIPTPNSRRYRTRTWAMQGAEEALSPPHALSQHSREWIATTWNDSDAFQTQLSFSRIQRSTQFSSCGFAQRPVAFHLQSEGDCQKRE